MDPRVAELLARHQIACVLADYAIAVDTRDWDLLDTLFTADATLDYTATGGPSGVYPEVAAWLRASLVDGIVTAHHLGTQRIDLAGDTASATTYVHNPLAGRDGQVFVTIDGIYRDRLRRDAAGTWRIDERRLEVTCITGELPGIRIGRAHDVATP